MKKILFSLLTATSLFLAGCLETTQEITLNEDGSGTVSMTNDMSALISMAKQMGNSGDMKEADEVIDSTISLKDGADSIPNLSEEEKELVRKGSLRINMDMPNEKFLTHLSFPFATPGEIGKCSALSQKVISETLKGKTGGMGMTGEGEMPEASSFDDYYTMEYSNGLLVKTLNKEKYAKVEGDEYFKGLKEAAAMGLTYKANYIIHLPRPVKTTEGKGITLSEDKKQVTLTVELDDFLEDPSKLEFRIEY